MRVKPKSTDTKCHPEPFDCHAEQREASQDKLREGSQILHFAQNDTIDVILKHEVLKDLRSLTNGI